MSSHLKRVFLVIASRQSSPYRRFSPMGTKATSGFFKGTKGKTVAGDANFMNSNDDLLKYIRKLKDVDLGG